MKKIRTLKDALIYELNGLYDVEKKLQLYLPRYEKMTHSSSLKKVLTFYIENADVRINKLKWLFHYLNQKLAKRNDLCIGALITERNEILQHIEASELRDAILTSYIQRILHFKISAYSTCLSFAHELRSHNVEEIIKDMLTIEKEIDQQLSALATNEINNTAFATEITKMKLRVW